MKISRHFALLLLLLIADLFLITSYVHEIFDPEQYLGLYVISRVGILVFGIYVMRVTKNWLYLMLTFGYLLFSFVGVSLLHISFQSV